MAAEQLPLHPMVPLLVMPQALGAEVQLVPYPAGLAGGAHVPVHTPEQSVVLAQVVVAPHAFATDVSVHGRPHIVTHVPLASHIPFVHGVPAGARMSPGQSALVPVHVSATSHAPLAARHGTLAPASASLGHAKLVPSQCSATSHAPTDARHVVLLLAA